MAKGKTQVQEFLQAKSMITPGAAGGIVMLVANTLSQNFDVDPAWVGLIVSFLIGLMVFGAPAMAFWQRVPYYVVNSLLIFCMASGVNNIGGNMLASAEPPRINVSAAHEAAEVPRHQWQLFTAAHAQPPTETKDLCAPAEQENAKVKALCEYIQQQKKIQSVESQKREKADSPGKGRFFKPWFQQKK